MPELDPRLLRITITLSGTPYVFEDLAMYAVGTKFTSDIANVCEIRIANMDKDIRDTLLTEGTPYSRLQPPKNTVLVEAGRVSTGLFQVFVGDITTVNVTQPPDIWLTMRAVTGKFNNNKTIAFSQAPTAKYSLIAGQIAEELELALDFQAEDKDITNFSFSGAAEGLVSQMGAITDYVDAYVDDDTLVVRSRFETDSEVVTDININTGMVGIPEFIDLGVRTTLLLTSDVNLGERVDVKSTQYAAADGEYIIFTLGFNLASRDVPFYYIIDATRKDLGTLPI